LGSVLGTLHMETLTDDLTWTSYSRDYMIIKNEVEFVLADDN